MSLYTDTFPVLLLKSKVNNGRALTASSSESHMAPLLLTVFSHGFRGQVASEAPTQPGYLWLFYPKVIFLSVIAGGVLNPTCQEITRLAVNCTWSICHDERKWIAQPLESLSGISWGNPSHLHTHTHRHTQAERHQCGSHFGRQIEWRFNCFHIS